jgi:hypothetical protein
MAPMIFNRVRLPVVSMTLSTPVLIQPEVTFVACVGGTASMNKSGSSHAREAFSASYLIKSLKQQAVELD